MNTNIIYKLYKLERMLHLLKFPILPRLIYCFIRIFLGAVIPYTAQIGKDTEFLHAGLGVVIHVNAVIGDNVKIMHNVTIGGRGTPKVPVIGNGVFIGTGAIILGDVEIGNNAMIGANAVVIRSVPPNSVVAGVPAKIVRTSVTAGPQNEAV
ncbi:MAG: serine acetyltransferase [Eubacterium sp.]|nr:serine acetyltransferase [Eubacterium sp.]